MEDQKLSFITVTKNKKIFGRTNRLHLLIGIINQSINVKEYDIAYEIIKRFMSDLIKAKYLPIFDTLFSHFKDDNTRFEAKLALTLKLMPLMNKNSSARFMKIIGSVIYNPASESIFKNNINPLRVGLLLYRVVTEV